MLKVHDQPRDKDGSARSDRLKKVAEDRLEGLEGERPESPALQWNWLLGLPQRPLLAPAPITEFL